MYICSKRPRLPRRPAAYGLACDENEAIPAHELSKVQRQLTSKQAIWSLLSRNGRFEDVDDDNDTKTRTCIIVSTGSCVCEVEGWESAHVLLCGSRGWNMKSASVLVEPITGQWLMKTSIVAMDTRIGHISSSLFKLHGIASHGIPGWRGCVPGGLLQLSSWSKSRLYWNAGQAPAVWCYKSAQHLSTCSPDPNPPNETGPDGGKGC